MNAVFRMDARDRASEPHVQERAQAEAELRRIRDQKRADQEKRAEALVREGLPASLIVQRTALSLRAVRALAKRLKVKLPSEQSWL